MDFTEQLAAFEQFSERAYDESYRLLGQRRYRERVLEEARRRFVEGAGLYGDRMFGWSAERLQREALEEHADGMVNYPVAAMQQGWPL